MDARLRLLDRDVLEPGAAAAAQLRCHETVAISAGEHVILRLSSPPRTLAGGRILLAGSARHRRNDPAVLRRFAVLASRDLDAVLRHELDLAGAAGASLPALSRITGLAPAEVASRLAATSALVTRRGQAVTRAALEALVRQTAATLGRSSDGRTRDQLALAIPKASPGTIDAALDLLLRQGVVRQQGSLFVPHRPEAEAARARDEARLASRLADAVREGGLSPPDVAALSTDVASRRVLDRLVRDGVLIRTHDRVQKRDILFHAEAIAEARRRLARSMEAAPGLTVSEAGAALGISRKFSAPLLEYLDSIRFTRRAGDRRVLAHPVETM